MPLADDFLRQAAERKEVREKREAEQRLRDAKVWGLSASKTRFSVPTASRRCAKICGLSSSARESQINESKHNVLS